MWTSAWQSGPIGNAPEGRQMVAGGKRSAATGCRCTRSRAPGGRKTRQARFATGKILSRPSRAHRDRGSILPGGGVRMHLPPATISRSSGANKPSQPSEAAKNIPRMLPSMVYVGQASASRRDAQASPSYIHQPTSGRIDFFTTSQEDNFHTRRIPSRDSQKPLPVREMKMSAN